MPECIPSNRGTPEPRGAGGGGIDDGAPASSSSPRPSTNTRAAAAAAAAAATASIMTQSVKLKRGKAKRKGSPQGPAATSRPDPAAGSSDGKRLRVDPGPDTEAPAGARDDQQGDPASTSHVESNSTEKHGEAQQHQPLGEQEGQDQETRDATACPQGRSKATLQAVFSAQLFSAFRGQGASTTTAAAAAAAAAVTVMASPAGTGGRAATTEAAASTGAASTETAPPKPGTKGSAGGVAGQAHHAHHPPAPEVPEAAECDVDAAADAEDEDGFDPLLFIRSLPPLEQCVPKHRPPLLPSKTRQCKRKTLVLDLDETLVHSTLGPAPPAAAAAAAASCDAADFRFEVHFNNQSHSIHVRRRPHLAEFMTHVAALFEVVVFTASQKVYAEALLNVLDPKRCLIKHRVFRDSCVVVDGNYLKDLTILGRDMSTTCIVDNSPQAFGFQPDNGIPIESWYDDAEDTELLKLLPFLQTLADDGVEDVRPHIASKFRLKELISNLEA